MPMQTLRVYFLLRQVMYVATVLFLIFLFFLYYAYEQAVFLHVPAILLSFPADLPEYLPAEMVFVILNQEALPFF